MTLPPGLQAIRERTERLAVGSLPVRTDAKEWLGVVDLAKQLADALDDQRCTCVDAEYILGTWVKEGYQCSRCTALEAYRNFGQ